MLPLREKIQLVPENTRAADLDAGGIFAYSHILKSAPLFQRVNTGRCKSRRQSPDEAVSLFHSQNIPEIHQEAAHVVGGRAQIPHAGFNYLPLQDSEDVMHVIQHNCG